MKRNYKAYLERENFKQDFQEFCEEERKWQYLCYLEDVGMLAHAELTSEPRDFGEMEH